ncbi:glycosyltransferase family 4 protein [Actinomyces vulturis]|uniref:glycosyltransferase family 4 protein n=1 Tax=Actinomyces vulturis TaxID=1857645 RepID=UPI000829949E|nr:glycosyltransferase family 4 protein [Actinomyces vulturis]
MTHLYFAANNAEIGGGEVMLLQYAKICRELGHDVTVVAPQSNDGVGREASDLGFSTVGIRAHSKMEYMRNLREWDKKHRDGVLWCHGHTPGLATIGHPKRIVHLHQAPSKKHIMAGRLAGAGSLALVVPSIFMKNQFPFAQLLWNWCDPINVSHRKKSENVIRVGFIGRLSPLKGIIDLANALVILNETRSFNIEFVIAGEPRFSSESETAEVEKALSHISSFTTRLGWVNQEKFYSQIDLLVVPSSWDEPFGLTLIEGMSACIPLVVTDSGAFPEILPPDYPFIARKNDPKDLARTIAALSTLNPIDQQTLVDASHERWRTCFSTEAASQRIHCFLTDTIPPENN